MALLEDVFKANPVTGVAIAVGVVFFGPAVLGAVAQIIRPATKALIKGGLVLYDQVAEIGATAGELFTEAEAELKDDATTATVAPSEQFTPRSSASPQKDPRKRST